MENPSYNSLVVEFHVVLLGKDPSREGYQAQLYLIDDSGPPLWARCLTRFDDTVELGVKDMPRLKEFNRRYG